MAVNAANIFLCIAGVEFKRFRGSSGVKFLISNLLHLTSQANTRRPVVDISTQEKQPIFISRKTPPESDPTKIDLNAPAGAPNSLGAESVRDGRPSTDDSVVEAMDEETPPLAGN
jgi:hypothetical protein